MDSQHDEHPRDPEREPDARGAAAAPERKETRGARRLRESGALFVILCGVMQMAASVSKATGGEGASAGDSPQAIVGAALALGAIASGIHAWRSRVTSWLLLGAALVIAHVTLFQVLAG